MTVSDAGWRVTVLDRGRFGAGCSHANCGFVCPSHVLPLAGPGAVSSALRTMLRRNPPLRVRPRASRSLLRWLFAFARRCNRGDMLDAGRGIHALLTSSRALYDNPRRAGCGGRPAAYCSSSTAGRDGPYAATDELLGRVRWPGRSSERGPRPGPAEARRRLVV